MTKVLIICGPTATGKTDLAARLAKRFDGELVSADSRQVYRGMELTVGKDRPDVPVWLYDVVDPDGDFSVSQWVRLARHAIEDIRKRRKLPIVVGGTGLYIQALLRPPETIDIPPDKRLRERLNSLSVVALQQMVTRGSMNDSDWNNPRRLIRKIEIQNAKNVPKPATGTYDVLLIGLTAAKSELDRRIDERMNMRLRLGMEEEAAKLRATYDERLPSMSALTVNDHAYARRQMTWFKKQPNIEWYDIGSPNVYEVVEKRVRQWYT